MFGLVTFGLLGSCGLFLDIAKTKAPISFAVTAKLICVFVFAFAKLRFSHNEAQIIMLICPCNVHPLTPHFYIVKLGFTKVFILFLFCSKHRFQRVPTIYVLTKNKKKSTVFFFISQS